MHPIRLMPSSRRPSAQTRAAARPRWLRTSGLMLLLFGTQAGFANMVVTVTPTQRVDTDTQVAITYSVTGAADTGTQALGNYVVRVRFPTLLLPPNSQAGDPTAITRAPDNSPLGPSLNGPFPFSGVSVIPSSLQMRWQAESSPQQNQIIDTTGAPIGSFAITWNRPASGQYDAAIPANLITAGYRVAPFNAFTDFTPGLSAVGQGVSTIIGVVAEVPEPRAAAMAMAGLVALAGASGIRRRRAAALGTR